MRKENLEKLLDSIYELEGLVHLAISRDDEPAMLPELIRRKSRELLEHATLATKADEKLETEFSKPVDQDIAPTPEKIVTVETVETNVVNTQDHEPETPVETEPVADEEKPVSMEVAQKAIESQHATMEAAYPAVHATPDDVREPEPVVDDVTSPTIVSETIIEEDHVEVRNVPYTEGMEEDLVSTVSIGSDEVDMTTTSLKVDGPIKSEPAYRVNATPKADPAYRVDAAPKAESAYRVNATPKAEPDYRVNATPKTEPAYRVNATPKAEPAYRVDAAPKTEPAYRVNEAPKPEKVSRVENETSRVENETYKFDEYTEPRGRLVFSINDRYRFRRELFNGSDVDFNTTLSLVASMDDYEEAEDYFLDELQWDEKSPDVIDFLEILKNYFK